MCLPQLLTGRRERRHVTQVPGGAALVQLLPPRLKVTHLTGEQRLVPLKVGYTGLSPGNKRHSYSSNTLWGRPLKIINAQLNPEN